MINYIAYLNYKETAIIEVEIVRLLIYLLYRQIRWNYVQAWGQASCRVFLYWNYNVQRYVMTLCGGLTHVSLLSLVGDDCPCSVSKVSEFELSATLCRYTERN